MQVGRPRTPVRFGIDNGTLCGDDSPGSVEDSFLEAAMFLEPRFVMETPGPTLFYIEQSFTEDNEKSRTTPLNIV